MLIDLHCHTFPLSDDSFLSPDQLIERARAVGLDGVCLTEHDSVWEPRKLRELAERHDFLIIPAIEVNSEDGHILVFGLNRYVSGMRQLPQLTRLVAEAGGAMIAAHPYRQFAPLLRMDDDFWTMALERAAANPAFQYVCALEAINGRSTQDENSSPGNCAPAWVSRLSPAATPTSPATSAPAPPASSGPSPMSKTWCGSSRPVAFTPSTSGHRAKPGSSHGLHRQLIDGLSCLGYASSGKYKACPRR
jgi:hypothetical protein